MAFLECLIGKLAFLGEFDWLTGFSGSFSLVNWLFW